MKLLRNRWRRWVILVVAAIAIEKPLAYLLTGIANATSKRVLEKFIGPDLIVIYALVAIIIGVYKKIVTSDKKGGEKNA